MSAIYHIVARLYLLLSLLFSLPIAVGIWLTLAQAIRKRLPLYARWLWPIALGNTLAAIAILLLAFVAFFSPFGYALAILSYFLSAVGFVFGTAGLWRLWRVVQALPPAPHEPPAAAAQPEGVWPPAPAPPQP